MWSCLGLDRGANSGILLPGPVWPGQSHIPVSTSYTPRRIDGGCTVRVCSYGWIVAQVSCVCNQKGVARRLAVGSLVSSPARVTWRISEIAKTAKKFALMAGALGLPTKRF